MGVIEALRLDALTIRTAHGPVQVDASVPPNETVAVDAAPPDARRLARTVAGLAAPVSGRILVDDHDVTNAPPRQRQIGYVPAGGALLPHLTVGANIGYGLRHRELVHGLARAWTAEVIKRLELGGTLDLRPHALTEAQRLRAAIARSVVCLPVAMVLDLPEGTGAEALTELVPLLSPPDSAGISVLVCTGAGTVLREAGSTVTTVPASVKTG